MLKVPLVSNGSKSQFSLSFRDDFPDFEKLKERKKTEFEIKVVATEIPEGQIAKTAEQIIVVEVINVEEVPYFVMENNGNTFSTSELTSRSFLSM